MMRAVHPVGALPVVASLLALACVPPGTPPGDGDPVTERRSDPLLVSGWSPGGESGNTAVLDPARRQAIVFGACSNYQSCAWLLDLGEETHPMVRLDPAGPVPPVRFNHSAVWDPEGNRMIVFGGRPSAPGTAQPPLDEVWILQRTGEDWAWAQVFPEGPGPAARNNHGAAWDAVQRRMFVYGGTFGTTGSLRDLWSLREDGETWRWTQETVPYVANTDGSVMAMAWDPVALRLMVYGTAWGNQTYNNGLLMLQQDGEGAWQASFAELVAPASRTTVEAVWDASGRRWVLWETRISTYCSSDSDMVAWDGSQATVFPIAGISGVLCRNSSAALWDPVGRQMVMIGGLNSHGNWLQDIQILAEGDAGWTIGMLSPPEALADPDPFVGVVVPGTGDLVLAGLDPAGKHTPGHTDVFTRVATDGGGTWARELAAGTLPPALDEITPVWDTAGRRLLWFGGRTAGGTAVFNEVHALVPTAAGRSWEVLAPAGLAPVSRCGAASVWDPAGNRMLVFGGNDGTVYHNDLWALEMPPGGPQWSAIEQNGTLPSVRTGAAAAWDADAGRLFLFGGNDGAYRNDVWVFDTGPATWSRLPVNGTAPTTRRGATLAWDGARDRLVLFGGSNAATLSDVAVLQHDEETGWTWTLSTPQGILPAGVNLRLAGWDASRRMFLAVGPRPDTSSTTVDAVLTWTLRESNGAWYWNESWPMGEAPSTAATAAAWDPDDATLVVAATRDVSRLFTFRPTGSTWAWRTEEAVSATPNLESASLAWAPGYGLVAHGPKTGGAQLATLDGNTWTWRSVGGSGPTGRAGQSAVWDPVHSGVLVFGGQTGTNVTWILQPNPTWHWTQIKPVATLPSPRYGHAAAWVPDLERMVVYGGTDSKGTLFTDTWSLTEGATGWAWTEETTYSFQPPSLGQFMGWDATLQSLVVAGPGATDEQGWVLARTGDAWTWTLLRPGGVVPKTRTGAGAWVPELRTGFAFGTGTDELGWVALQADPAGWSWHRPVQTCDAVPPVGNPLTPAKGSLLESCPVRFTWTPPHTQVGMTLHLVVNGIDMGEVSGTEATLPSWVELLAHNTWQIRSRGCPGAFQDPTPVSFDAPEPVLEVVSAESAGNQVRFLGTASSTGACGSTTVTMTEIGDVAQEVPLDAGGNWSWNWTPSPGHHEFRASARNGFGVRVQVTVSVDIDTCAGPGPCSEGRCVAPSPSGTACDDQDDCLLLDQCDGQGNCRGIESRDCDDGNPCTDDGCLPAQGCTHANNTGPCDDGEPCTTSDTCAAGTCAGTLWIPPDCVDGNPCTDDGCVPGRGCVNPANTLACDDGEYCTKSDRCAGGVCAGVLWLPAECADGNACTDDLCIAGQGCVNVPNHRPCDDNNPCTNGDACSEGACAPGPAWLPPWCDDQNPCTDDSCTPGQGCVNAPNQAPCDDGNPCTVTACAGGTCTVLSHLSGCCASDASCSSPTLSCLDNRCAPVHCRACAQDSDCGAEVNRCAALPSGPACLVSCAAAFVTCPEGSACGDREGGRFCIPTGGDCQCQLQVRKNCSGPDLLWFDSCDKPGEVAEDCQGRGCASGACCQEGTHLQDGACRFDTVEPAPDTGTVEPDTAGMDDGAQVPDPGPPGGDLGGRDDGLQGEDPGGPMPPETEGRRGGGCTAGGPTSGAVVLLALALAGALSAARRPRARGNRAPQ